ncbi:MAG: hypothetical protein U0531_02260 [Dehalococcoidia bacterium]
MAKGDLTAIETLLGQEVARWRTMRVPKQVAAALWHGVQTVELVAVGANAAHVTCTAEGEYRFAGGRPQEVSSALDAAMRLAAKVADMILYDVPNLRLSVVRVDVYTTFHTPDGLPEQRCILTTVADRATADNLDFEALLPVEIINRFDSRYEVNERGIAEAIDPGALLDGMQPVTDVIAEREPAPLEE